MFMHANVDLTISFLSVLFIEGALFTMVTPEERVDHTAGAGAQTFIRSVLSMEAYAVWIGNRWNWKSTARSGGAE